MYLASASFVLLIILNVFYAPFGTFNVWRVSTLLVYLGLVYFLWRGNRAAAFVGVLVAVAGTLILGGGLFFLWPFIADQMRQLSGALEVIASMFLPCLLNMLIVVVLVRALLSNNRWRGP